MVERSISLSALERIMKKAGAPRVSDDAKTELKAVLEEVAEAISRDAVKLAEHAGRKTVKAKDVRLAAK